MPDSCHEILSAVWLLVLPGTLLGPRLTSVRGGIAPFSTSNDEKGAPGGPREDPAIAEKIEQAYGAGRSRPWDAAAQDARFARTYRHLPHLRSRFRFTVLYTPHVISARRAIREMHRQVGPLVFDENGLALRGLLIRHLVMPGDIAGTQQILEWIASELGPATYVDLMDQYYPAGKVSGTEYVEISRRITPKEYRLALEGARAVSRRLDHRAPDKHLAVCQ